MLGIVVLNWNGKADTLGALASLRAADLPPSTQTLVADNGSADGSVAAIRAAFPKVRILENGANLGFAEGNNRGWRALAEAGADTLFFLNNDAVVAPDAVTRLCRALDADPDLGAVSPRIYSGDGARSGTAGVWYEKGMTTPDRLSVAAHVSATVGERCLPRYPTECVCGCALLIRTELMARLRGFDPSLFAYYEDADLSLRLRHDLNLALAVVPGAAVWHKGSRSTGGALSPVSSFYLTRNARRVARERGTANEWRVFDREYGRAVGARARFFARGGSAFGAESGGAALLGGWCALRNQTGIMPAVNRAPWTRLAALLARLPGGQRAPGEGTS